MNIKTISIIGLGLIGGSYGLSLKQKKSQYKIKSYARREETRKLAIEINAVDEVNSSLKESVKDADLVILTVPIEDVPDIYIEIEKFLKKGAIVTDAASTKKDIIEKIEKNKKREDIYFVGSHPMAGSDKSGLESAKADLFNDTLFIITPRDNTNLKAIDALQEFYRVFSDKIITMPPDAHDLLVAFASHLPYFLSVSLVDVIKNMPAPQKEQIKKIVSSGFKDTTRIAMSVPVWGKDIACTNKENILKAIENYEDKISWWKEKIKTGSLEEIQKTLEEIKEFRRNLYNTLP